MNPCEILVAESSRQWYLAICRFLPSVWQLPRNQTRMRQIDPRDCVEQLTDAPGPVVAFVEITADADTELFPALARSVRRRQRLLFACPSPPLPLAGGERTAAVLALRQLGFAIVLSTAADVPAALRLAMRFAARHQRPAADARSDVRARLPWPQYRSG